MSNVLYYQSKLEAFFQSFLVSNNKSNKTIVNYKSDLKHFLSWLNDFFLKLEINFSGETDLLLQILPQTINDYLNWQKNSHIPIASINRRLSSIRLFFLAAKTLGLINSDPTETISNVTELPKTRPKSDTIINKFEAALRDEGAAKSTVKNYSTDIENFLYWIDKSTQK
jgi:site-specific recombinase XerD